MHAIIILQIWRNTITIHLIRNLPLQFYFPRVHAIFYVWRVLGPTCRRRIRISPYVRNHGPLPRAVPLPCPRFRPPPPLQPLPPAVPLPPRGARRARSEAEAERRARTRGRAGGGGRGAARGEPAAGPGARASGERADGAGRATRGRDAAGLRARVLRERRTRTRGRTGDAEAARRAGSRRRDQACGRAASERMARVEPSPAARRTRAGAASGVLQ